SVELRDLVVHRARNRCEYCQVPQATQVSTFPVDHVIPVVLGGPTADQNLCLACPRCNAQKWTRVDAVDPESGEVTPLFHPRKDTWATHFHRSKTDLCILEGSTPQGHATMALLDLNSPRR